jgi:hypothetical protein
VQFVSILEALEKQFHLLIFKYIELIHVLYGHMDVQESILFDSAQLRSTSPSTRALARVKL